MTQQNLLYDWRWLGKSWLADETSCFRGVTSFVYGNQRVFTGMYRGVKFWQQRGLLFRSKTDAGYLMPEICQSTFW